MKDYQQRPPASHKPANVALRFVALFIDMLILSVPTGVVLVLGLPDTIFLLFLGYFAYDWYFWMRQNGQTPGKMLFGIRVVKADGSALTSADVLLRSLGYFISALAFGFGFLWALVDRNSQSWHDKIAQTIVVVARRP